PERLWEEGEADEDAQDAEKDRAPGGLATPLDPSAGASPHEGRREFVLGAGGGGRHDESVSGDPESGEAQVLRDLAQRTLDRARELRIVDLPPDEPGRDEQECDDEQAVAPRRDTQPANGPPPVLREEDGPDHGAQPEDQGGESDLADDALRVPKAVVADRLRDVAQAVVEPARALLVASAAARPLEAARDPRDRGPEVESLPATSALLDDGLVRAANRVPEDRLERVGVDDALERKLERGAEARRLLVPGLDELGGQPSRELRADGLGVERLDGALAEGVAVVQRCPCPVAAHD